MINLIKIFLLHALLGGLGGCQTWTWANTKQALVAASTEPLTLIGVGGALVMQIDHIDQKIVQYLAKAPGLFSTPQQATQASDASRSVTSISMNLSNLLVRDTTFEDVLRRGAGNNLTAYATAASTVMLQDGFMRQRPDGGSGSMPSAHTSRAFACSYLAHKNYQQSLLPKPLRVSGTLITYSAAFLTGLARVEGKKHYPSDVFMGMAYGTFISSFTYHLTKNFFTLQELSTSVSWMPNEKFLQLSYRF
ncbi:MAG: phosphatase PAP2 family protein [Shewanellaceae bacterium]|nr:phosphatase PAP2 family protein [Shewanellaceae bacterium]